MPWLDSSCCGAISLRMNWPILSRDLNYRIYTIYVDISFDAAKNARNIATRGISFERALAFEWDSALIVADSRRNYGEPNFRHSG